MIIDILESGLGAVWKTDDEQGSLMKTVKSTVAVFPSTVPVSVYNYDL
jgi:hypothetical protein